jgi:hypothetical protein
LDSLSRQLGEVHFWSFKPFNLYNIDFFFAV